MRSDGMLGIDCDPPRDDELRVMDVCYARIVQLLQHWERRAGAPRCPCCGQQMRFIDRDKYGTVHCECEDHGPYTVQVAA